MVKFVELRREEFDSWRTSAIRDYAKDMVAAGRWSEDDAVQKSEAVFSELLPEGTSTKNNYLYSIVDQSLSRKVGTIWYAVRQEGKRRSAFVYDFLIFEEFRRKGYATLALHQLEEKVRGMGLDTISLNVFAHNLGARELYNKVGYREKSISMSKALR